MDSVKFTLLVLGLVLVGAEMGSAIMCHRCTSGDIYQGKDCMDLKSDKFLIDCSTRTAETGLNYTMCRKFDQVVEEDHIIDRDCAAEGSDKCVLRSGTKDVKLEYCECKTDKCNAAPSHFSAYSVFFMIMFALTAAFSSRS